LSGWGHWGRDDGSGNAASQRANGSGLLLGVDRDIGTDGRLGLLLGHGQNSLDVDARASSAHVNSRQLGVYGDTAFGALHLRAAAIHTWQDVDTHRHVAIAGLDEHLSSRRHVHGDQAYVEASYRFAPVHGHQLEPFANLARTQLHAGATQEGNGPAALAVAGANPSVNSATLGLRDTFASKAGLHLHASLAWQHGWGDLAPTTAMHFAAGGERFAIAGVPLARHALLANLGMNFPLARKVTLDASYLGQFATRYHDQGARLSLDIAF
jgi:outer membrane autotransporter protein